MSNIAIIFLIIGFFLLSIYFIGTIIADCQINKIHKKALKEKFKDNIKNIAKEFDNEKQEQIRTQEQEIVERVHEFQDLAERDINYYKDLQTQYTAKIKDIRNAYEKEVERVNQEKYSELATIQQKVEKEVYDLNNKYELTIQDYEARLFDKQCEYEDKEKELKNKIEEKRIEVQNLIENFKQDEKVRQKQDFYRIVVDNQIKEDINKLKDVAMRLNNPSSLLKFVWKDYYENGFNQMIGRVLGKNAERSGIYKITNLKNQMCYIGQSVNIKNRWRQHCKRGIRADNITNNRLYDAMWTEGLENFTFQVVEFCDKAKLTEREKFYIDFFQAKEYGYNSKT